MTMFYAYRGRWHRPHNWVPLGFPTRYVWLFPILRTRPEIFWVQKVIK